MMVMTEGHAGGDREVRRAEQAEAAELLHCEKLFWGGYLDTQVPLGQTIIERIEEVVADIEPAFIFVHHRDDTHQDHRNLARATVTATRYSRNVLFYEGPTTQTFTPSVFVDISQVMDDKVRALEAHASQIDKTNVGDLTIVDLAHAAARFRGTQGRVKNAEGFVPLRLFINVGDGA